MTPENLRKLFERIVAVRTFNKVYDENSMLDVPMYLNMPTHFDGTNTTAMHYDDERVSMRSLSSALSEYNVVSEIGSDSSPDRIYFAGNKKSKADITPDDKIDVDTIGKAIRFAAGQEKKPFFPITIGSERLYVAFVNPQQARDLQNDPEWKAEQKRAFKPKILSEQPFDEAIGFCGNVIVFCFEGIEAENVGTNGTRVARALILGKESAVLIKLHSESVGMDKSNKIAPKKVKRETAEYVGIKKIRHKFDGWDYLTDVGVVTLVTAAVD